MRRFLLLATILLPAAGQDRPTKVEEHPLDQHFEKEWSKLRIKPAAPCDDATFLRRLSLDLTGILPTPEEVRAFLKSKAKDRRAAKIEELMVSPAAADYFAHTWITWLTGHQISFGDTQRVEFGAWIRWLRKAWDQNLPYNRMVEALLSDRGSAMETPAVNFALKHLVSGEPPVALATTSARVFLGKDIRCAQCHDHPFEPVTQDEFWGYVSFFRPVRMGRQGITEASVREPKMLRTDLGELFVPPAFFDDRKPEADEPLGKAVARLTLSAPGDVTARAVIDRIWKLFFGRAIAPGRNIPGRPELLELLTRDFLKSEWSLRQLVRTIVTSKIYQLSSEGAEADRDEYAVGQIRLMNEVQFLRAYVLALNLEPFYRAQYQDPQQAAFIRDIDALWVGLLTFAKEMILPKGRDPEATIPTGTDRMALKMMNNRSTLLFTMATTGHVYKILGQRQDPAARIEEFFLLLLSRPPTAVEKARYTDYVEGFTNFYQGYQDVYWVLFNSAEFVFVS